MKIIFGTTNSRKIEDIYDVINANNFIIEVLTLNDIGWDLGEIEENGSTLNENSLIKAKSIYDFCKIKNINLPILADDAGLFVESLNGEPGIYTARYADDEFKKNKSLPKHQCVIKLLKKLDKTDDRRAEYRVVITCMLPDGQYFQTMEKTGGSISREIFEPIIKPYFFTVFIPSEYTNTLNRLTGQERKITYRYKALEKTLIEMCNKCHTKKIKK